jgi:hypothetical protein
MRHFAATLHGAVTRRTASAHERVSDYSRCADTRAERVERWSDTPRAVANAVGGAMIEKTCNLWIESAEYRCILTSAALQGGEAVLDTPSARAAAARFAGVALDLGRLLTARGNHVHMIRPGLCSFPVKQFQWASPTLAIIERSAQELLQLVGNSKTLLPRPGCGEGELAWADVAKVLAFLPNNIIIVNEV